MLKRKFSKILGVGLTLALLISMLVTAVPVSAATMTAVSATPADATETVTTTYTIGFTTATTYSVKTVDIEFADGFTGTAADVEVTGIGAGTITATGLPTVTYTVTDAAVIPAGTAITISFSGVVNPTGAGDYEVTVTTNDATPAVVDTGTTDVTITPLPASFLVVANVGGPDNTVNDGEAFSVTITAKEEAAGAGATETGYVGDHFIDFTYVGDPTGTLPDFELISFTDGVGTSPATFILTLATESDNQIIATDTPLDVAGMSAAITINPTAFSQFTISSPPGSVEAGADFVATNITVTAQNADGETVTDYTGTVSWTSSDPLAELPDAHALVAGTYEFAAADFILKTVGDGTQTITVTDGTVSKTSDPITVTPAAASEWTVEAEPTSIRADNVNESTITATAYDEFGNVDTNYDSATATFTASLGDIDTETAITFADGVAENTLTSDGEVGTATIKVVNSGTLPDATTTVELLAALLTEVWVDDDGADANPGTLALPVASIQKGIDIAAVDGTVNVLPGTYEPSSMIGITTVGLTLKSTDGTAVTIIDSSGDQALQIIADDVTVEGFTFKGSSAQWGIWIAPRLFTEGVTVKDNIFTGFTDHAAITLQSGFYEDMETKGGVNEATISGNVISDCKFGINLLAGATNNMVSGNTITGCTGATEGAIWLVSSTDTATTLTQGNTISGNTITSNDGRGIWLSELAGQTLSGTYFDDNLIEKNTISGNATAGIEIVAGLTITGLTITGNDIIANTEDGILIGSWGATNAINNNNVYGNDTGDADLYDIANATAKSVDAENNWWGTAIESTIAGMVSDLVDYSPWLNAAYPDGESTTAGDLAIVLEAGWNLISLPLIPTDSSIETVLADLIADVTVEQVQAYSPGIEDFLQWASSGPLHENPTLTAMDDGVGFWLEMESAGTLVATGYELCEPAPAVPPQYEVALGWNMIGFKFTTEGTIADYLGDVSETLDAIYGYVDGAYFIPATLEPGLGYWIAVTSAGTIYPDLVTPD